MFRSRQRLAASGASKAHKRLAIALAVSSLLPAIAYAQSTTNYDILVNHDAFVAQVGSVGEGVVDGPVGADFVYRAKVKINGNTGTVSNVVLVERLPAGAIFQGVSAPAGVNCAVPPPNVGDVIAAEQDISCVMDEVTAADFVSVDFRVQLPKASTGWEAKASASAAGNVDPDDKDKLPNHSNIARTITTYERAELAVSITSPGDATTFTQGDVVNYVVQVSNADSPYAFPLKEGEKASIRFPQPEGTKFQGSPSGNGWQCVAGEDTTTSPTVPVWDCTYTVPSGQEIKRKTDLPALSIPLLLETSQGEVDASVSVKGLTAADQQFLDANPDNNVDDVRIHVVPNLKLDMALTKSVTPQIVDKSATGAVPVVYTLKASRNSGELVPQDVVITDTLPAGVSYVDAVGADWSCAAAGQVLTCQYSGVFTPNSLPDLKVNATVDVASVPAEQALKNQAKVSASNESTENIGKNNEAEAIVTVSNKVNLGISKSTAAKVISSEQEYQYTIKVGNNGNLDVLAGQVITVTDKLDSHLQFLGVPKDSAWVCTPASTDASTLGALITCTLDTGLAKGKSSNLVLNVKAYQDGTSGQFASISNKATLTGVSGRDGVPTGGSTSNDAKVNISEKTADLTLNKTAAITGASDASGAEVVYTMVVKNDIPANSSNADLQEAKTVIVTDTVNNLLTTTSAAVVGAPLYANDRYLTAEVVMPAGTTATADKCTLSGGNGDKSSNVSCTLHNVPVSDSLVYTVIVKARQYAEPTGDNVQTSKIYNTGKVTSPDTAEFNPKNNESTAEVSLEALTDLTVTKQASPEKAAAGQAITYTLTAKNSGPSSATKVTTVDQLPIGAIWVGSEPKIDNGKCELGDQSAFADGMVITAANRTLTCSWPAWMGENAQRTVKYQLRSVTVDYPASLDNTVDVSSTTPETNYKNNSANESVPLDASQLDVLINMRHTADGIPLDTGATQYTITVTNSGASLSYATGVQMIDQFPVSGSTAAFQFVSLDSVALTNGGKRFDLSSCKAPAAGSTQGPLVCDFSWLAPGESVEIKFTMQPEELLDGRPVGTINHSATVSADAESLPDQDVTLNNATTDRTSTYDPAQVTDPGKLRYVDLSVTKVATQVPAGGIAVGDSITYTLTVKNEEDASASPRNDLVGGNAVVTDILPEGLELVGAAPSGCSYDAATRTLSCTVTDLEAGKSVDFSFAVKVTAIAQGQTSIANKATLTSPGDPVEPNNEDTEDTPVATVDLALSKTVSAQEAVAGDALTYTLTVVNNGPATSKGAVVTDVLPATLDFVSTDLIPPAAR